MGGGNFSYTLSEDDSFLDNEYPEFPYPYQDRDEDESFEGSNGFLTKEVGFDGNLMKRKNAYREILKSYDDQLHVQRDNLFQAKTRILSYTPGSWVSNAGGKKGRDYVIPKTTTLLLIGPKGSGKSSLINKVSRVFEDDNFASQRAQVTFNSSSGEGTYFLQEYMIPRNSTSFCLFDTRSLSGNFAEDCEMLIHWMTEGVFHGELIVRDSDSFSLKMALKYKAQKSGSPSGEIRKVNFVIFVVNGFSVLRAMNSDKEEDRRYMETVVTIFRRPYLSFRDDKPVIVVTHGDLLSLEDQVRVRVYLGEKLDVPPAKQIFDIPENSDPSTELTIVDMIRYSLEHADKNLPCKRSREWVSKSTLSEHSANDKVYEISILMLMFLAVLLGIACVAMPKHPSCKSGESLLQSQFHKPCQPRIEFPSTIMPNSAANRLDKNQGSEYQESHDTSTPTTPTDTNAGTSAPHLPSESVAMMSECQEPHGTYRPTTPTKSNAATSTLTFLSESVSTMSEHEEPHGTSTPTMPAKSNAATSTPRSPLESVATIYEHGESHVISGPLVPTKLNAAAATSALTSPLESVATMSEDQEPHGTSRATVPAKSNPASSALTLSLESDVKISVSTSPTEDVAHCPCKHPEPRSRSPSPKKRRPEPAVKWHKIRHLWWAPSPNKRHPKPAVEWHKIRHLWWDSD